MKTYKDFMEFVHQRQFIIWECVLSELRAAGFKRWQIWLYQRRMRKYAGQPRFRIAVRRAGRIAWWCLVVVGAFFWFQRLNELMDMTTYKNQTEIARNVVYVCGQMPDACSSATELVKKVMK